MLCQAPMPWRQHVQIAEQCGLFCIIMQHRSCGAHHNQAASRRPELQPGSPAWRPACTARLPVPRWHSDCAGQPADSPPASAPSAGAAGPAQGWQKSIHVLHTQADSKLGLDCSCNKTGCRAQGIAPIYISLAGELAEAFSMRNTQPAHTQSATQCVHRLLLAEQR